MLCWQAGNPALLRLLSAIRSGVSTLVSAMQQLRGCSSQSPVAYGVHCWYRSWLDMPVLCSFNRCVMHEVLVGDEEKQLVPRGLRNGKPRAPRRNCFSYADRKGLAHHYSVEAPFCRDARGSGGVPCALRSAPPELCSEGKQRHVCRKDALLIHHSSAKTR